jgi:hypothetical protein
MEETSGEVLTAEQELRQLMICCGLGPVPNVKPIAVLSAHIQKLQAENAELKKQVDPMFANHLIELEARLVKSERALESIWKIAVNTPSRAAEAISREHSEGSQ